MKAKRRRSNEIQSLLPEIKSRLAALYGERLVQVILYGSFAKNRATTDSDIDIAIVLKGEVEKIKELSRSGDALFDLMLDSEELISIYPLSEVEICNDVWPLYRHIREEGVRI
ncbi:MAG: nucleotidyltransferase domain-containing protein [bacterium]|nr:nucleotidyltransferase domain-containing protein [bacterium]